MRKQLAPPGLSSPACRPSQAGASQPPAWTAPRSSRLMVCCPMTTQIKNYPFEVVVAGDSPSAVLADQVKSLDRQKRRAKQKGAITPAELADVRAKVRALIG
jgi:mRNA-degrading endonuclease toxin of MazEF toxin-antitoxin module